MIKIIIINIPQNFLVTLCSSFVLVTYQCVTNYPHFLWFKTANIYFL